MATDNDNVIDIDGSKETGRRSEPKKEEGKEGEKGKKGKQKTALYVVGFVFAAILGYLAYRYYENNIAGGTGSAAGAAPDDSGSGAGAGGGAPVTPTPPTPLEIVTGGQGPITINVLGNGSPVKSAVHKVAGHAAGPKITTPTTFVKAAQKIITLAPKTATTPAIKVQKAVATPGNLDITKAIGDEYKDAEATANAHGHTANPIVHTVSPKVVTPANLDVTKAIGATNVKNVAPKTAPKAAPKPAPKGIAKRPA